MWPGLAAALLILLITLAWVAVMVIEVRKLDRRERWAALFSRLPVGDQEWIRKHLNLT